MGFAMSAYYSGRSEGQIVKVLVPVTYIDFHGMYPAVCSRQGLWDLMKADRVKASDAKREAVEFLGSVELKDLYRPGLGSNSMYCCGRAAGRPAAGSCRLQAADPAGQQGVSSDRVGGNCIRPAYVVRAG